MAVLSLESGGSQAFWVKRYYPPEERCFAKRLLVVLLAILFFQIYSADEDLPMGPSEVGGALYDPPIHEDPLAPASAVPWSCRPHDPTVDISQFLACNPAAF
ncbi:radiation-inducible immediate-early gene IEX-1 isoform X2 [Alligator mississippiensis]|uniref:radiation-inducible immediate-early gene IEX-1 isoform X2 n=1 Tax=Alligator mississippiensis TaxID=8496 RepID=UPI0009071EE0|nr:radiation-inducible immediate-early gene IEX-1 isoform X2 [Alligator mississippiensis]